MTENQYYQIQYLASAKGDYDHLDGSQKILIDKALNRIRLRGMQAGQPLRGALAGFNKLKHKRAGLRIIFTQENQQIKIIEIVAIGKREDKKVYHLAEQRIKKLPSKKRS
ncbi:addiction module toxin RelE [Levilactobacillus zymae]|uniref:type II toxin-antitoxin system RelE family toxin n=1 Tax=Levilactobacillus zymae TaxID=267363 RepID=UPI0028B491D0|nr:addiction module toxin RelE [Levilactobacillus zymae]MDT6980685.1 addiction module toxin RelE [Levilactobacillus zymae]